METRITKGGVFVTIILILLLIATIVWAAWVWNSSNSVAMGEAGWAMLIMGTVLSLVVGCGLMALMFYSNRSGHDDEADPLRPRDPPQQ